MGYAARINDNTRIFWQYPYNFGPIYTGAIFRVPFYVSTLGAIMWILIITKYLYNYINFYDFNILFLNQTILNNLKSI